MSRFSPRSPRIALFLVVLLAAAATSRAAHADFADDTEEHSVQLDSDRSSGSFQVKVMWLLSVSGRFGKIRGSVRIDPFRNQVSVDARIDVDTIRMSSPRYENWVKSPEFFDAGKYPQIEFDSAPFPQARLHAGGELPGVLTLRGVRQPVRFELQSSTCVRAAYDCPIEVAGTIQRSAFDMHSHNGTLSDKVELRFKVYATASSSHAGAIVFPPTA